MDTLRLTPSVCFCASPLLVVCAPSLQLLVHLCYRLQPPACYYYRDMTPHRLQRVIAARGVVERRARDGLTELLWQLERLNTWRRAVCGSVLFSLAPVPEIH
jgi:hypothetical protein